jgi:hypothetical protein
MLRPKPHGAIAVNPLPQGDKTPRQKSSVPSGCLTVGGIQKPRPGRLAALALAQRAGALNRFPAGPHRHVVFLCRAPRRPYSSGSVVNNRG